MLQRKLIWMRHSSGSQTLPLLAGAVLLEPRLAIDRFQTPSITFSFCPAPLGRLSGSEHAGRTDGWCGEGYEEGSGSGGYGVWDGVT